MAVNLFTANPFRSNLKRSGKPKGVYVTESEVRFPETAVGQSNEVKVKVCNDSNESSLVSVYLTKNLVQMLIDSGLFRHQHFHVLNLIRSEKATYISVVTNVFGT
jgi:hypothetical protein